MPCHYSWENPARLEGYRAALIIKSHPEKIDAAGVAENGQFVFRFHLGGCDDC